MARSSLRLRHADFSVLRRNLSITTTATTGDVVDSEWALAKPYHEIPGPKPLPIPRFGNVWRMLPFGTYGGMNLVDKYKKMYKEFGPVINLRGVGRADLVCVFKPGDAEKVFRAEGPWPARYGLDSLEYYRRVQRPDIFEGNPGMATSQGEEWWENRSTVNPFMLKPSNVAMYADPIEDVADDFIKRIENIRDSKLEMPEDFVNEIRKWSLESISLIAMDTRLGCLDGDLKKDSDAQIVIDSVNEMVRLIYKLDVLPSLWKLYSTKNFKKLTQAMDNITEKCLARVNAKIDEIKNSPVKSDQGKSILELLLMGDAGKTRAMTMAMDMMIAGVDTTSNSAAITLYYLAKYPEAQEKVLKEVLEVLPNKGDKLPKNFQTRIPYIKAAIKEAQRMIPLTVGTARTLPKDIVLSGYQIPKGTDLVLLHAVMSNQEDHFIDPDKYIPERWLKTETDSPLSIKNVHPFVFMPFGFGPRMCLGRRFAELELQMLVAKVIRNYELSYHYEDMQWDSEVTVVLKKALKLRLEDRPK